MKFLQWLDRSWKIGRINGVEIRLHSSMLLHEIGHTLAAQFFKIEVKSIVLWLFSSFFSMQILPPSRFMKRSGKKLRLRCWPQVHEQETSAAL